MTLRQRRIESRVGSAAVDPQLVAARMRAALAERLRDFDTAAVASGFADRMTKFAGLLAVWGARMNLTARPYDADEVAFHIIDSLMPLLVTGAPAASSLKSALGPGKRVLDVGSGAGFPGLVLASACEARFTLAEARRKRASFLEVASGEMGLTNVTVEARRLLPSTVSRGFDLVLTRALGATGEFHRLAADALAEGGVAMLYAGATQRAELAAGDCASLASHARLAYELRRGGATVRRALILWRKDR